MLTVCVSGWRDEELLPDLVASVKAFGWPIAYVDGAYRLYLDKGEDWHGDVDAARKALGSWAAFVDAPGDGPWPSEAAKKQALMREVLTRRGAGWVLWLDADERLESDAHAVDVWPWLLDGDAALLRIWNPSYPHAPEGFTLPRLINLQAGVEFRPPRDFDLYRGGQRIAWPEMSKEDGAVEVPWSVLRIRHEHRLRSLERHNRNGVYAQRRKAAHGNAVV